MTHMRYWAMSFAAALAGGFLAIDRFAFAPGHARWIAFGVAIGAAAFALGAFAVALLREDHTFSGLSALSALLAGWTIIATRTFPTPTALWLAFAGGLAVLALSLRALALHETTVERVVHALEIGGSGTTTSSIRTSSTRRVALAPEMRSWITWLAYTGLALAGAFVVLSTFAWRNFASTGQVSPRWIVFGVGVAAAAVALGALLGSVLATEAAGPRGAGTSTPLAAILLAGAGAAVAIGMIVTMAVLHGTDARWVAFGLGSGMVGVSVLASTIHELTSEHVRHELEVARAGTGRATVEPSTAAAG